MSLRGLTHPISGRTIVIMARSRKSKMGARVVVNLLVWNGAVDRRGRAHILGVDGERQQARGRDLLGARTEPVAAGEK